MRVVLGPRIESEGSGALGDVVQALCGAEGEKVSLSRAGVADLSRPLTRAEVALLRQALVGGGRMPSAASPAGTDSLVGYICQGAGLSSGLSSCGTCVVAVTDHANLTWQSPLTGPNDDEAGPRFPSMTDIYEPGVVQERLGTLGGIIVKPGVVAGVGDDGRLNAYETETSQACGHLAVSSELVPVVIVAAHMGLRVAAAVVITGTQDEETGSGRS